MSRLFRVAGTVCSYLALLSVRSLAKGKLPGFVRIKHNGKRQPQYESFYYNFRYNKMERILDKDN